MKTAISIPDDVFAEVDRFAREHKRSRSEVLTMAAREFIEKMRSRAILESLNEAYAVAETEDERAVRDKGKKRYAEKVLKGR